MNSSPKLVYRQIRIFVLPEVDGNHWVETVVGRVIKPVVERHKPEWMWFSRYGEDKKGSSVDCDISKIPAHFCKNGLYRSVRFRACIDRGSQKEFEQETLERIHEAEFAVSGFIDYPYVDDLAHPRFLGEPRTPERKMCRAELMARYLDAGARLYFDALKGPDAGNFYELEPNENFGSSFEAMRHLFCNMTNAPTPVWVDGDGVVQPNPLGEVMVHVQG
jgi:hypothetical protein